MTPTTHRLRVLACASLITLAGCGGTGTAGDTAAGGGPVVVVPTPTPSPTPTPTVSPTPTPTPAPTPAPSPTPTPTPSSGPVGSTLSGVLDEGDSISVFWSGNHTGIYAAAHPGFPFYGKAVGGSTLATMAARFDADVVFKPKVVTILIGANDVYSIGSPGSPYAVTADYLNALFAVAAKWRATGAKVIIGTVLGQCIAGNPNNVNGRQNTNRVPVNAGIRAAVGTKIDGVTDYAADPVIGTDTAPCDPSLFDDGLHPGQAGQNRMSTIYGPAVDNALGIGAIAGN